MVKKVGWDCKTENKALNRCWWMIVNSGLENISMFCLQEMFQNLWACLKSVLWLSSLASMNSHRICVISPKWEWPVIKVLRSPLHVIALTISRVRCFLTAGCAVTCAHQAFLCLLGCLLSTLMAKGGWVQASPDHCSQSWVSQTDRRNRNHINPARTKRKAYCCTYILNKNRRMALFAPFISSMCHFDSLLFTGVS